MQSLEDKKRLATRAGFIGLFWERFNAAARRGARISETRLFWKMEYEMEEIYKYPLFPSYEAFKKYKTRHNLTNPEQAAAPKP